MFDNECMFEFEEVVDIFAPGTIYEYVPSAFLDGYINHVKPVKAYLLDRYTRKGPKFQKKVWQPILQDKHVHTNLRELHDDVLILAETKKFWWLFWFDCDVSDCQIGRQYKGYLSKEEAVRWFDDFMANLPSASDDVLDELTAHPEYDYDTNLGWETITGYRELPTNVLRGWVSW